VVVDRPRHRRTAHRESLTRAYCARSNEASKQAKLPANGRAPDVRPAPLASAHVEVDEYARIAAAEDDHWWYRNTRALVGDLLSPWLTRSHRILDAGCGPGGNGAWLAQHGTVVGVDVSPDALAFVRARRPETRPARASLEALPFPDGIFDVVVGITVLYTIDDDQHALHELARVLAPGGALLLLEPAFESLRREHDVTVHRQRRYRRAELVGLARDNGLIVQRATYAYSFLAPPAAVLGVLDRMRRPATATGAQTSTESDVDRRSLDRLFSPLATAERRLLSRRDVPFGTSVIVVASRAR
jgi:SAM-dependent methyltransferase